MASTRKLWFTAYSSATGLPVSGLTPSFSFYENNDGTTRTPQPSFTDAGDGAYYFDPALSVGEAFVCRVDLGDGYTPRFYDFQAGYEDLVAAASATLPEGEGLTDTIALTTTAKVRADLGLSDTSQDATIERYILAASQAIEEYCGRNFRKETVTETMRGSGTRRLLVSRTPLVSITSITDDGSTVDASSYSIDSAASGIIYGDSIWQKYDLTVRISIGQEPVSDTGEKNLSVVYVGGYVLPNDSSGTRNLPYDLEEACILTATALYRNRGRDRNISGESVGDASVNYGNASSDGATRASIIPAEAQGILNQYRRIEWA